MRGMEIQAVGIGSISYDEESQKLINMRNQGAMLSDPSVREGYVQGAMARGVEAAGSNSAGAAQAFMGVGIGMNAGAGMAGAFSPGQPAADAAANGRLDVRMRRQESREHAVLRHVRGKKARAEGRGRMGLCMRCEEPGRHAVLPAVRSEKARTQARAEG